ncbi:putative sulfate exporter family transporter [Nostoc sp. 3335mG]|nr:putative sulfate exporter family transporter [Nostoc sp. 3335mG]
MAQPIAFVAQRRNLLPGILLCLAVTLAAMTIERAEAALFGRAWLEALVLAILLGTIVRTAWTPDATWQPGIRFSAKTVLEIAVVLLGASVSGATIVATGPAFLLGIALVVAIAIGASYTIGRILGLRPKLAMLVACGNSICGNSAIAAVAPVIGADSEDVAASIAFTAVLGVIVVIGLPMLALAAHIAPLPFGALAGLTVYAVPQVIAAAAPLGAAAVQIGTLTKLVRVLMLGPVCVVLALLAPRLREAEEASDTIVRPKLSQLVPWFILGFLALVAARSIGLTPTAVVAPAGHLATMLTIVSMAALGLGCDIRTVARAGRRVTMAVVLSLLTLGAISWALIRLLGLA